MGAIHAEGFTESLYLMKGPGYLRTNTLKYSDDKTELQYSYWKKGEELISFRARPLPGCCGVLVVYYVRPSNTLPSHKIIGQTKQKVYAEVLRAICEAAKHAKYAAVMMTLLESSGEAITMAKDRGFIVGEPCVNGKTHNRLVGLWLDLKQEVKKEVKFVVE